jgi:omega-amidase
MNNLRIRVFQISVSRSVEENLDKVERAVSMQWKPGKTGRPLAGRIEKNKLRNHFDFLVLPELFTTGYHSKSRMKELSEGMDGRTVETLKSLAREYGITIAAGSFVENNEGNLYNTSVTIDHKGDLTAFYRKTHLFTTMNEDKLLTPGNKIDVYIIGKLTAGTMTCFELRFPEIARKLALQGAQIIFCPAEWSHPKSEVLFTLARARAIENQLFLALANIVGKMGGLNFCGGSMIAAPDGTILTKGSPDREEILDAEIDIRQVNIYRKQIPALPNRREELY